jgi:hypothetical protein
MSTFDDATISEAHRGAHNGRLEMLRRHPELRESKFASALRSALGNNTDCGKLASEADHLFGFARQAYENGDPESGDAFLVLANAALDRYHQCLLEESLAPPKEFLDSEA